MSHAAWDRTRCLSAWKPAPDWVLGAGRCPGAGFLQQPQDLNLVSTPIWGFLKLLSLRSWQYQNSNNNWGDRDTAKVLCSRCSAPGAPSSLPGSPCSAPYRAPRTQRCSRALSLRAASPAQASSACPQGPAPALSPGHLPLVTCETTPSRRVPVAELCSGWHSLDQPPPGRVSRATRSAGRTHSQGEPGLAVPQVSQDPPFEETARNLLEPLGNFDSTAPFCLAKGLVQCAPGTACTYS